MAPIVCRSTLPEASSGTRPAVVRTASAMCDRSKLSSMMRSTSVSSASASSASVSTSTSSGRSGCFCLAVCTAAARLPAAMMWFSLIRMASYKPIRWLWPPPQRTAYFCARRSPGTVLRVSRMRAAVPAMASTWDEVMVAVPDSSCRKFSAERSAVTNARAWPERRQITAPAVARCPSWSSHSIWTEGSSRWKQASNHALPATTASSRQVSSARPWASAPSRSAVASPAPMSSAKARSMSLLIWAGEGGERGVPEFILLLWQGTDG